MSSIAARPTKVRHIILWLTVLLYMVTYFDRVLISVAMPEIQKEFGFSTVTVGLAGLELLSISTIASRLS